MSLASNISISHKGLPSISSVMEKTVKATPSNSIFSAENYQRICKEKLDAKNSTVPISDIINLERSNEHFFYDYKKMSMSSSNLYKANLSTD